MGFTFSHPSEQFFFHGSAWARVLYETYRHEPVYFCQVSGGQLRGLLPVMEVSSVLTGVRGVSLPFTDFCTPLFDTENEDWDPYEEAVQHGQARRWRYLECRSGKCRWRGASPSLSFHGHTVNLEPGPELLFQKLRGSVRRGIRRAQGANLRIEFSQDIKAMHIFYKLHCLTRRRHGLPPQPFRFFDRIHHHVVARGQGIIVCAFLKDTPIASSVFFHQGREAFFKFGASDYTFQGLRPNNLVMWEAIKHFASSGMKRLNLGRTSLLNTGLRRFKRGFGAEEHAIEYCKYDLRKRMFVSGFDYSESPVNRVFRWISLPMLRLFGSLLYPHLG